MTVEQALQFFQAGMQAGRTAQSYLVTGLPEGGAGDFAVGAVQTLFCTAAGQNGAACGKCVACARVAARREPDVLWVEPVNKSRVISVDQIRDDVLPRLQQTAFGGGWKVVVLRHADRLHVGAANAFLKTLEEPPPGSLILLLTDRPEALLPTILSRCQRIAIHTPEKDRVRADWEDELETLLTLADRGSYIARSSRGERISRLLKRLGDEAWEQAGEDTGDEADDETVAAREAAVRKGIRTRVLQAVLRRYRDILVLTLDPNATTLLFGNASGRNALSAVATRTTPAKALEDIGRIETMNRLLERNLPEALVFGRGFAELN